MPLYCTSTQASPDNCTGSRLIMCIHVQQPPPRRFPLCAVILPLSLPLSLSYSPPLPLILPLAGEQHGLQACV